MHRYFRLVIGLVMLLSGSGPLRAIDPQRAITQYVVQRWSTTDGLPLPAVSAITQTSDGYLWTGSQEGLSRFDGMKFEVFDESNTPELESSYIRALEAASDGSLWIGTLGGGLFRLDKGVLTHYGRAEGLPDERVLSLSEGKDGSIWGGTLAGGVFHIHGAGIRVIRKSDGLASDFVSVIHAAHDGTIWAGGPEGLSRIRGKSINVYTEADGLSSRSIASVIQALDGSVWVGTERKGLNRIEHGNVLQIPLPGPVASDGVLSLLEGARGSIWFGTRQNGLWRMDHGRLESLGVADGLSGDLVSTILEDREGTIWAGTNEGLTQLKDGSITTWGRGEGMPNETIRAIYQHHDGTVWMATRGGLVGMLGDRFTHIDTDDGLPTGNIFSLAGGSDGSLWIGTFDKGLVRMYEGRFTSYTTGQGLAGDFVLSILEDRDGALWIGTSRGLSRLADGQISTFRRKDGLGGEAISVLHQDRRGNLWIGTTDGGLTRFRDNRFTPDASPALRTAIIMSIHEDDEGVLWIGTMGGGVLRKANGHVRAITRRDGLYSDSVLHVNEDGLGNLWMSSTRGIFRVSRDEIEQFLRGKVTSVEPVAYGRSDGMKTAEANGGTQPSGWRTRDGNLWFPTSRGAVVINPTRLRTGGMPPNVVIEQALVDGRLAPPDAGTFPPGSSTLEFNYTGITLVAPDKVTFRYKLEGFDENWIEAGTRRAAFYTNLPPGNYEFKVLAANSDGIWSEQPATRIVRLEPRLHQRNWFFPASALALLVALFMIHRYRMRIERRRALRLAELEKSMVRGQKMESLGQMASGIAHDFNNALMTALPWADLLQRKYPQDETVQKASSQIRKSVHRGREVTRQLLDFAQPKKPQQRIVELRSFVEDQLGMVRPSIRPEIEIVVKAPGPVHVLVDPAQLSQAVLNLALNARDAMPAAGTLTFVVRTADSREAEGRGLPAERFGALSISDTGTGMNRETMDRIFDPFFTTKSVGEGTGLGLAVAHRIMEQNAGTIEVESQLELGTTFHLLLPLANPVEQLAAQEEPATLALGRLGGMVVLLVDDDLGVAEGLSAILEAEGARVQHADTGPAALRMLDAGLRVDRVILDLGLPEMSGDVVHVEIRKRFRELPVIISSGYGERARIARLLEDPETQYLQKPYEMEELIAILLQPEQTAAGR